MLRECSDACIACDSLMHYSCFHFNNVDSVVCNDAISVLIVGWFPAKNDSARICWFNSEL